MCVCVYMCVCVCMCGEGLTQLKCTSHLPLFGEGKIYQHQYSFHPPSLPHFSASSSSPHFILSHQFPLIFLSFLPLFSCLSFLPSFSCLIFLPLFPASSTCHNFPSFSFIFLPSSSPLLLHHYSYSLLPPLWSLSPLPKSLCQ